MLEADEGCAGFVWPWIDIQTVDRNGEQLPRGTEGIIRVRSPEAAFYVDEHGQPTDMYVDGWFYTGDVGRVRKDGLLTITGRSTDVINRGGVVVAPEYIEEVLRRAPSISDVAVFGLPNERCIEERSGPRLSPPKGSTRLRSSLSLGPSFASEHPTGSCSWSQFCGGQRKGATR